MTVEKALELKRGDIVVIKGQDWEVMDTMLNDDVVSISAMFDDMIDVFKHHEVSSKE